MMNLKAAANEGGLSQSKIKPATSGGDSSTNRSKKGIAANDYPRRDLDRLHCPAVTYLCACGALPRRDDIRAAAEGGRGGTASAFVRTAPCVPCAYKICNFDIALDSEFSKRVPNQRPEQCPRSFSRSGMKNNNRGGNLDGTMGYRRGMNVLTVGDGDLTFSLALARLIGDGEEPKKGSGKQGMVVATSYENCQTLRRVYFDFDKTLASLRSYGENNVVIGYNVDATRLNGTLPEGLRDEADETLKFHRICWNFPCTAIGGGQDGQNSAMEQNKELVRRFVANALPHLDEGCGEIHMAHKTKPPYNQWGLERVALEGIDSSTRQFEFKGRIAFDKCTYQGYTPRKALDRKSFPCHDACIYVFGWKKGNGVGQPPVSIPQPFRICHSTIPENQSSDSNDELPKPPSIIPVTESVIEKVRSIHLQNAGRMEKKRHNKKQFRSGKQNGETRKKRRKKRPAEAK